MKPKHALLAGLIALSIVSTAAEANLIASGDFGSSGLAIPGSWTATVTVPTTGTGTKFINSAAAYEGLRGAFFRTTGDAYIDLTQTITTATGTSYQLSFWLASAKTNAGDSVISNSANVSVDGFTTSLLSLSNVAATAGVAPNPGYTQYSYLFTATSTSTTVGFRFTDTSTLNTASWYLDSVAVEQVPEPGPGAGPLPEPGTLGLFGLGLVGIRAWRNGRQQGRKFHA